MSNLVIWLFFNFGNFDLFFIIEMRRTNHVWYTQNKFAFDRKLCRHSVPSFRKHVIDYKSLENFIQWLNIISFNVFLLMFDIFVRLILIQVYKMLVKMQVKVNEWMSKQKIKYYAILHAKKECCYLLTGLLDKHILSACVDYAYIAVNTRDRWKWDVYNILG